MKRLVLFLTTLSLSSQNDPLKATTRPKRKTPLPHVLFADQILPRDTLKAGQDIELRKVQAMLSGQRPKKD